MSRTHTLRYAMLALAALLASVVALTAAPSAEAQDGADVVVSKAIVGDAVAGEVVNFVVTVTNNGPGTATGVVLTDTLPAGMVAGGPGIVNGLCKGEGTQTITCAIGDMVPGRTVTLGMGGPLSIDAAGTITNTATAAVDNDTDPSNNSASVSAAVIRFADVSVAKSGTGVTATIGENTSWTLSVSNAGPVPATGVVLTDNLPPSLRYVAIDSNCNVVAFTQISCSVGTLAVGASASFNLTTQVTSDTAPGTVTNQASVASNETDPNPGNNAASANVTTARAESRLAVGKVATVSNFAVGGEVVWSIGVSNPGPEPIPGTISVTDTLPAGVTHTYTQSNGFTCFLEGSTVSCARAEPIPVGATFTVTIGSRITNASAPITNTVVANAPALANPSASATATVRTSGTSISGGGQTPPAPPAPPAAPPAPPAPAPPADSPPPPDPVGDDGDQLANTGATTNRIVLPALALLALGGVALMGERRIADGRDVESS